MSKISTFYLYNTYFKLKVPNYINKFQVNFQNELLKNNLNKWSQILSENPYARALVSPIRRDVLTDARLPSAFLLKFLACKNPKTNKIWILPDGLKYNVIKKVAQSRWVMNKKKYIKYMGKGQWKRMLPDFAPSDAIWRNDMDDFVLTQFRKRIIIELKNIQKYFIDIELMNNMFTYDIKNNKLNKKIGCIIHKFDDDRIWCLEKVERQEFKVPVINSFILFDINDNEDEWLKILISKKSIAIPLGIDTVNAIFWIWKFRSYF